MFNDKLYLLKIRPKGGKESHSSGVKLFFYFVKRSVMYMYVVHTLNALLDKLIVAVDFKGLQIDKDHRYD